MKTRSLIALVSSFAITVLVGTVFIGANAVFGVVAPTENPDNARGITPTFSGVNVTGNSSFAGAKNNFTQSISVGDALGVDLQLFPDTIVSDALNSLKIWNRNGNGGVQIGGGAFENNLSIAGNLKVGKINANDPENVRPGNIEVYGSISNPEGNVSIGDDLNITSRTDATPAGAGAFKIADLVGRWLTFDANEIMSHGGPLYLNNDSTQGVIIGSAANNSDLTINGVTTMQDVEILDGSTFEVNGDVDLPFQTVASNLSNNTVGLKNTNAFCPADTTVVSCNLIFNGGFANVQGPGTFIFGQVCQGRYNQSAANLVTGMAIATCL